MKKNLFIWILIFSICANILPTRSAESATKTSKQRNEIIVKYIDESDMKIEKTMSSLMEKYQPQKLVSKKIIDIGDSKLEIIEVGRNENINSIAKKISQEPNVDFAVPNTRIELINNPISEPTDPGFAWQWGLDNRGGQDIYGHDGRKGVDIDALKAWKITEGRSNVIVGVVDTGIDISHEDLHKNIFINKREIPNNGKDDDRNGYVDDINGWDFFHDDNSVYDEFYTDAHATHVAGIIAANDNDKGIIGVAPNVKILPLKFIDNSGYVSDAIEAIEYGSKMGVKIFNCSWTTPDPNKALELAMRKTNAVFVCAAGNYSNNVGTTPVYPACFNLNNVISVASMNNSGELSYFSNYGKKIAVAAPGEAILSTIPENQYAFASGTSMAAPFVTGIAALLQSKGETRPTDIVRRIKGTVDKSPILKSYVSTGGYVNAYQSLKNRTLIHDPLQKY